MIRMGLPPFPHLRRNPRHGSSCCCVTCGAADLEMRRWSAHVKRVNEFNEDQRRKDAERDGTERAELVAYVDPRSWFQRILDGLR